MTVDLVLVNPNNRIPTPFSAIEPPLWLGLIAGYNLGLGKSVAIVDAEAEDLTVEQTVTKVHEYNPEEITIVVMGNNPSVSSTPKMGVTNELLSLLVNAKLTGIHPIALECPNTIIKPFDGLPSIPWHLLPMDKYRAHNWHCLDGSPRSPYASIYTSLNCPFDCYYCNIHTLYKDHNVLLRHPPLIWNEVNTLVEKYGIKNIKIWDELFALNEDRVITICSGLEDYNLNIWAYARIDSVTKKMLKAMKRGGINWLAYGFESVKDKKFISKTEDVIKMTRDAGINIIANFMFGLPNTTQEDDERSLDFAWKHLFEYVNFYVARPYPGSRWYNDTKPTISWDNYDQYGNNRSFFRDKAFQEYFTNPDYLAHVTKLFGEQAKEQIKQMLQSRIGR